jgi:predicted O-methyltransferase YrrM
MKRLPALPADASALAPANEADLRSALPDAKAATEWPAIEAELAALGITAKAGGVNPGDRQALYHLLRHWAPIEVLEVGTHVGASTAHLAAALRANGPDGRITTVDIIDVNDPVARPWERAGSALAPAAVIDRLGMASRVRFVAEPSLGFLGRTAQRFDLIFLDGDHSAATVYQEVPAALRLLKPGGRLLLHDYFPGARPLWDDGVIIPGPWLAIERLRAERVALRALPLGELPWPTKRGSRVTSLALLARS